MKTKLINLKAFKNFFQKSSSSGIILLFCVVISLLLANSPLSKDFSNLLQTELGFEVSGIMLRYPIILWVNDGLMAIFFLLVGLEIKREVVEGELSSFKQASLPVLAAIGGVAVPALIYHAFNHADVTTVHGWGVPMATDIAFALGILSLLGDKVPTGLKIFLAALAIVDDLIAIMVIAIFYSGDLEWMYLGFAAGIFALQMIFNRLGLLNILWYVIPGLFMWYFIHHSGIHATIAGVLTAITLPTNATDRESPLEKLEHFLSTPVNFVVMPIFAIANTNITFQGGMVEGLATNMGLGIVLGLFVGKPIGIVLMSWLSVKLKLGQLPEGADWFHILGLGFLAGIGFTMSIFIALLSYKLESYQIEAKFAILIGSVLSGLMGYMLLSFYNKKQSRKAAAVK
ncbi:Na+/H+ antiporter NhaA [Flavobacterium ardleyense]|uniref:Na+/H+ antiporter NhaA n=1 Tax=Flavobacterium ardleyense TaxID=2038737 RepID=UPI00298BEDC1|nr:Na+/H+ antiporter NhaA [Flavobacterium ardleyense]